MNKVLLLLSLIFSLLQGTVLPPVFAEGFLFVLLVSGKGRSLLSLFLSGLLFDLFSWQRLGTTSLIFILGAVALTALRDRIFAKNVLFTGLVVVLINIARSFLVFGNVGWDSIFVSFLLALLTFGFLKRVVRI